MTLLDSTDIQCSRNTKNLLLYTEIMDIILKTDSSLLNFSGTINFILKCDR